MLMSDISFFSSSSCSLVAGEGSDYSSGDYGSEVEVIDATALAALLMTDLLVLTSRKHARLIEAQKACKCLRNVRTLDDLLLFVERPN